MIVQGLAWIVEWSLFSLGKSSASSQAFAVICLPYQINYLSWFTTKQLFSKWSSLQHLHLWILQWNRVSEVDRSIETSMSSINAIAFLAADSFVMVMTIASNGIFLIILRKKHSLQTPSNMLLGALSCVDFLIGIVAQPLWLTQFCYKLQGKEISLLQYIKRQVTWFLIALSFAFIVTISLDRYIAVCYPFWYSAKATCRTHIVMTSTTASIVTVIYFSLTFLARKYISDMKYAFCGMSGTSLVLTAYWNLKVYNVIKQQNRRIRSMSGGRENRIDNKERRSIFDKVLAEKRAIIIAIITLVFFLCYAPLIVRTMIKTKKELSRWGVDADDVWGVWVNFCILLNSLMNPIIYCARLKCFRTAAKEMICRKWVKWRHRQPVGGQDFLSGDTMGMCHNKCGSIYKRREDS